MYLRMSTPWCDGQAVTDMREMPAATPSLPMDSIALFTCHLWLFYIALFPLLNADCRYSLWQATDLGILDTAQGSYINIDSGQSISMNEAIEKGLVLVEKGIMKRDERDRKVSSLHIDEEEEEVSLPLPPPYPVSWHSPNSIKPGKS